MAIKTTTDLRVGQLMQNIATDACLARGFKDITMITKWSLIVGDDMANMYLPMRLYHRSKGNKILLLWPSSMKAEFTFQYVKDELIAKINQYFGTMTVNGIKILSHIAIYQSSS